ncbi:sulfite exporter TauE/SafE family protein [Halomonas sp. XH26]|uniref:sulfite exporter TauE/SafE family protein n=1 Tax=Halomonadaceae TaxID=28256 RepID=UPI001E32EBA3|nr:MULTISPECIES: sulfite exporter TauE/SafE family protein [unclassified Halomonas]MCD6005320.1 sulfite exporter TauE/SafE family protein [Halomonas sp. IOP_6]MCD6439401.1 sulfite exporter TauE/SafE family protein [Halomonas sp.]UTA79536.1 sulfite exporter TauE/SafE family protein [Halomonas sp. XH26]
MGVDWVFVILMVVAVLLTGISKSGFAGGVGVVAVPLISLKASPAFAVAVMLPLLIVMDIFSLKAWWRQRVDRLLWLMFPPAILGVGVGYLTYGWFDEALLKLVLGIFSVLFGLWGLFKPLRGKLMPSWVGRLCGGIAGFTSFIAHAGGPPLNFYLLQCQLTKQQFLGTAVVFLAITNLVKLVPYTLLGLVNIDNLTIALLLMPVAWLGVRLGLMIQKRIDGEVFFRVILCLLILLGIRLIMNGIN